MFQLSQLISEMRNGKWVRAWGARPDPRQKLKSSLCDTYFLQFLPSLAVRCLQQITGHMCKVVKVIKWTSFSLIIYGYFNEYVHRYSQVPSIDLRWRHRNLSELSDIWQLWKNLLRSHIRIKTSWNGVHLKRNTNNWLMSGKDKAFKGLDVGWTQFSLQQKICYSWVDLLICLWMKNHKVRLKYVKNDVMLRAGLLTSTFVLTTCKVVRCTGHTHTSTHVRESKITLHRSWESIRRIPDSRCRSPDSKSMRLGFLSPIFSGIHDSLTWYSGFHKKKFPGFR